MNYIGPTKHPQYMKITPRLFTFCNNLLHKKDSTAEPTQLYPVYNLYL